MALSIVSIVRENGASCDHVVVTIDDEGQARTIRSSFRDVDAFLDQFQTPLELKRALILLWARYRRGQSRAVIGVDIA